MTTKSTPAEAGTPARTLVASYCFPPYSDTAGIVTAKRVREAGESVDVVCNTMDSIRHKDYSLVRIGGDLVRRFVAVDSTTAFSSWKSIEEFAEVGLRTALRWQEEQGPYEKLYSRAQFAASHFLAAQIKIANPAIRWTAEFSDPLSHDVQGNTRTSPLQDGPLRQELAAAISAAGFTPPDNDNLLELCETIAFALADTVVFTNPLQRDYMLERCADRGLAERARDLAQVSPHPTLPREFYSMSEVDYATPSDKVNIGYFGNFYANRGVGLLLEAVAGAPRRITDELLFHIFTAKPEELAAQVEQQGVQDTFRIRPYADYLDFLAITDAMDVLLVNDAVTPHGGEVNPFLPSKWSDYKGSTTPVWAIIEEGSMLDRQEAITYRTPVQHLSALQATLAQLAGEGARVRHTGL